MCSIQQIKDSLPILEDMPMGVLITNLDGEIQYVNDYLCDINGYSRVELMGQKPSIFKSMTHQEGFYKDMWNTILAGKVFKGEMNNKRKDGSLFWQKVVIQPFTTKGEVSHFVAYIDDITESRFDSLLLGSVVSNSYDTHLLWDKDRICFKAYPSSSIPEEKAEFYKSLVGHRLENLEHGYNILTEKQILDHYKLFDEIDNNDGEGIVGSTFKVVTPDGKETVLQVLMQRFNSNKFYETIRDVTDFYKEESNALQELANAIEGTYQLNYNIRTEINEERSRAFIGKDS